MSHGRNRRDTDGWQQTNSGGISRVIGSWILLLLLAAHLTAQAQKQFEWRDASGNVRSLRELEEILQEHQQWIKSGEKAGTRANLADTNLSGVDLKFAQLQGAFLPSANLTNAILDVANLKGAILNNANLTNAKLNIADLTNAILIGANLTGAHLEQADLTGAWVNYANFDRATFEPKSLPTLSGISQAENLELVTYYHNPAALAQLRKQCEEGGLREQERKITYALKRREAELSWARGTSRKLPGEKGTRAILWSSDSILANLASFTLNKVFFDWTCQYGMSPGRPLMLGVVLWFLCSLLYLACIHAPGEAGLYRIYGQSIRDDPSAQRRVERISPLSTTHSPGPRWLFQFFRRECLLLRTSMFFSLMSAFNIGFRDINFGRWLRLLTRQEFDIKAVGWARVIAGWQSLISVYLIALWVLTYFGRPFD
jgi:uncharacterized protein YjbI with pentapeptide repeats